ncbi:DUF4189 domain-containing protein [Stenotrophomonas maltophilia]|uniref:DUF4189 domain-containing protein n=1 Tax=Stenotrophomonas maltophilia TaxID=40324 RepID=UPI0034DB3514
MRILVSQAILASSLILGVAHQSFAEGNCPAGYYPIAGQGARGCAPIPGATSGGGTTTGEIRLSSPTGRWVRTWGAIASSKNTQDAGVSTGKRAKELAEQEALSKCASGGAGDCKVDFAYFNQCASWVVPSGRSGGGQSGVGGGPTPERALFVAQLTCKNDQPGKCVEFYANCTKPIFEEF